MALLIILTLVSAVLGFGVGILINALADAMPIYRRPRPPQYADGSPRPMAAWSGVMAFAKGLRAGPDGVNLAWRHPIVEVVMALMFGFLVANWGGHRPFERFVVWFTFLSILMLITVIDIEHRLILFPVIIPSSVIALALSLAFPDPRRERLDYIIGAVVGFVFFFFLFYMAAFFSNFVSRLRGREIEEVAFGFGDVMLAGLCGLMIGWPGILLALIIAIFAAGAGAIIYIILMIISSKFEFFEAMPYGPYITLGTALILLWSREIAVLLGSSGG